MPVVIRRPPAFRVRRRRLVPSKVAALNAGVVILVPSASAVNFYGDGTNGSTAASGGTPPYAYQWHASTTANFTASGGTALAGQTSQNLSYDPGDRTLRFYRPVVTDSAAQSATTQFDKGGQKARASIVVGILGDSIASGPVPGGGDVWPTIMATLGATSGEWQSFAIDNEAISGMSTAEFLPSHTVPAAYPGNYYGIAEASFLASGVTDVIIALGTNNGLSASVFGDQMETIALALIASLGVRIHIPYPTYGEQGGSYGGSQNARFQGYQPEIDALVNDTTIFAGAKNLWDYSATNYVAWAGTDDVHPNAAGQKLAAAAHLKALMDALYGEEASGTASILGTGNFDGGFN